MLINPASGDCAEHRSVAVIEETLWRTRFSAAPDVVGRPARFNGHPLEIVGVVPAGFAGSVFRSEERGDLLARFDGPGALVPRDVTFRLV